MQTSIHNPGMELKLPFGIKLSVDTKKSHASRVAEDSRRARVLYNSAPKEVKSNHEKRLEDDAKARNRARYNRNHPESSSGSGITSGDDAGYDSLGGGGDLSGGVGAADGSGGQTGSSGATSPLLEGSMSFEELIGEICNGIDLIFVCKRSTVVVTDYETLYRRI